ncbi:MAG: hypothetical protein KDE35_06780 [Geminicoccaceae bacterium]|nr:hypothetical protein [Geminicoccaceae bacterium]
MSTGAKEELRRTSGSGTDLWNVVQPPTIWAVHFLISYLAAAILCARADRTAPLDPVFWTVMTATAVALMLIALVVLRLWRVEKFSTVDEDLEFERNTPEERHRFLAHVSLMLSVLSAVGVLYVAMPVLLIDTCR